MAGDYVDLALIKIDYSGGAYELDDVRSMTVNRTDPKALVKTMNRRRRARGRTRTIPEFTVELEVAVPVGDPEVDYETLQSTGEDVNLYYEEGEGGRKWQLLEGAVDDISAPYTEAGESRKTVRMTFIDHLPG